MKSEANKNLELHFIGVISTAKESLARARSIICLAEKNPKEASSLAACATVLLAAAIEQAVETKYSELKETEALEQEIPIEETQAAKYDRLTIWVKIQSLPNLRTSDNYRLRLDHAYTKSLEKLIETRNDLMHVKEDVTHLTGPGENIQIVEGEVRVTFKQQLSGWLTMKLSEAKRFSEAVEAYFEEVIDPEPDLIQAGKLLFAPRALGSSRIRKLTNQPSDA